MGYQHRRQLTPTITLEADYDEQPLPMSVTLFPRAYVGLAPQKGTICADCRSLAAWWTEATNAGAETGWWRCCVCCSSARPADRIRVVDVS
jgi:hypothetical protein